MNDEYEDQSIDIGERLVELLLDHDIRISNGDRWLHGVRTILGETPIYTVYYRRKYMKTTQRLYEGLSLLNAMEYLLGEDEDDLGN